MRPTPTPVLGALVLASLLLAGCTGTVDDGIERSIETVDAPAPDTPRGEDEYWMVWIRGNETDERRNQAVCSRLPPDYRIDHANRSIVYDNRSYAFDPGNVTTLLAFDHEDRSSSCPEAERIVPNPPDAYTQAMGEYGELTLTVHPDGTLVVDGETVPLGQAAEVTYQGTPRDFDKLNVDGQFRVEVLGAWDKRALRPGDVWG